MSIVAFLTLTASPTSLICFSMLRSDYIAASRLVLLPSCVNPTSNTVFPIDISKMCMLGCVNKAKIHRCQ
uniref:Uncharacterized protein n=1 Tax=Oryza brachyantha TaxID=4533 RepID=J3LMT9_ORYBR